ncbi:uncharacterized protein LOC126260505 [Schistocerca nitens]|uniref:uncharacterized protein LOC126260505 n=1 Tax=Schistocerca nitens TaxID=7011 RepID=UPI002118DA35|nr:uncharacterized protein LOC126260505 [Schistocerca nitens]
MRRKENNSAPCLLSHHYKVVAQPLFKYRAAGKRGEPVADSSQPATCRAAGASSSSSSESGRRCRAGERTAPGDEALPGAPLPLPLPLPLHAVSPEMRGRTHLLPPPPLLLFFLTVLALQARRNDAQGMEVRVQALVGEKALLPCDVTPPTANDTATLVIWFKDEITPIYSYDARGKFSQETEHWKQRHVLGERASFETAGGGATAALTFRRVVERDQGVYRCRVDFRLSPSRNTRLHLTVVD